MAGSRPAMVMGGNGAQCPELLMLPLDIAPPDMDPLVMACLSFFLSFILS